MEENQNSGMTPQMYLEATRRTWNDQGLERNTEHAILGVSSEIGELASQFKKVVGYGKEIDLTNVKEELGDLAYFIHRLLDEHKVDLTLTYTIADEYGSTLEASAGVRAMFLIADSLSTAVEPEFVEDSIKPYLIALYGGRMIAQIYHWCENFNFEYESVLKANIAKLYVRFPDKFSQDSALIRNIEAEITALESSEAK